MTFAYQMVYLEEGFRVLCRSEFAPNWWHR